MKQENREDEMRDRKNYNMRRKEKRQKLTILKYKM